MMTTHWIPQRATAGIRTALFGMAVTVALTSTAARADDKAAGDTHPGYVDGSSLAKLADVGGFSGDLVEVTLRKPMLRALAKTYQRQSPGFSEFLKGLYSIEAVISSGNSLTPKAGDVLAVEHEIARLTRQLDERGWERMARVREDGKTITVYAHLTDGEDFDGLTVFIHDPDGGETTFANIAGKIDLGMLPVVGTSLQIPGLALGVEAITTSQSAGESDAGKTATMDSKKRQSKKPNNRDDHADGAK